MFIPGSVIIALFGLVIFGAWLESGVGLGWAVFALIGFNVLAMIFG
jgi:hypothetical protein